MTKLEFLEQLRKGLSGLPQEDIDERLSFYSEMIEDQIEDGVLEDDAVLSVGTVDEIVAQAVAETPLVKIAKEGIKSKRRLSIAEIVLLCLGAPLWLPLGFAAAAVVFSLYVSLWSVIISLWAIFISFAGCSVGAIASCAVFSADGHVASGIAMLAVGIVCAGLTIFAFYVCKFSTSCILLLTKKIAIWIKNCFIRKEVAQ